MGNSRTATLTLRLIDQVSGPARASAAGLSAVVRAADNVVGATQVVPRTLTNLGRSARRSAYDTAPMSVGILAGAAAAGRAVYQYEKMGNAAEAVGLLTEEQRRHLEAYARVLNQDFPFVNRDILEGAFELLRSGQNFEQMMGSLRSTLNTSLAGDIGLGRTADIMTNVAQSMRLPMETAEQVKATMADIADVLAYGATKSNTDIAEMAVAFRYVAPLAAATGMSLREMATATMMLANNGIKGSNAGTGLRFALIRLLKPTKDALDAFQRLGINIGDFVKGAQTVSSRQLVESLALDGIDAGHLADPIDDILTDPKFSKAPAKLIAQLTDLISQDSDGILDTKTISDSLARSLLVLGTQVDLRGFLNAVRDNPDAEALFPTIFGARHAAKVMAVMAGDFDGTLRLMETYARGAADRMARIRMKGLVGDVARFNAGIDNLIMTLSTTGVMGAAITAINGLTDAVRSMSEMNPELLEFGTYALLAMAGLAPLGFLLSGVAAFASFALNPVVLLGGAIAALSGYLAVKHWSKITSAFSGFWASLKHHMGPGTRALVDDLGETFSGFWEKITSDHEPGSEWSWRTWGRDIGKGVADGLERTMRFFDSIGDYIDKSIDGLKRFDRAVRDFLKNTKAEISAWIDWAYEIKEAFGSWFSGDGWGSQATSGQRKAYGVIDNLVSLQQAKQTVPDFQKEGLEKAIAAHLARLGELVKDWSPEARAQIMTYAELKIKGTPEALAEAEALKQKLDELGSMVTKPSIDQSDLDSTLRKAQEIGRALKALGGVSVPQIAPGAGIRPPRAGEPAEVGPQSAVPRSLITPQPAPAAPGGRQLAITNHNTFHVSSTDPMAAAAETSRILDRKLARNEQVALSGKYG